MSEGQTSPQPAGAALAADPEVRRALRSCVAALQRLASYQLDPPLDRRLRELGERKEFLSGEEHDELLALARFSQQRALEKLEASAALKGLGTIFPDLAGVP